MRHRLAAVVAALAALPVVSLAAPAHADGIRVRIRGHVHADGDAHVRVAPPHGLRVRIRGGWSLGLRFAEPPPPPPPPPCEYECGVPTYYTAEPAPPAYYAPPAVATYVEPEPLPRWGLGVFAGSVAVDGRDAGSDLGLLGRFRLSEHLELEAELAKSELDDGGRVDRRVGAALLYDFWPRSRWSLFVLGGAGYGRTETSGGSLYADQGYGELGAGITWRLADRFHVVADLRGGRRHTGDTVALQTKTPVVPIEDREEYSRFRLGGLFYF